MEVLDSAVGASSPNKATHSGNEDKITYIYGWQENLLKSTKKSEFGKVAGYKENIQN